MIYINPKKKTSEYIITCSLKRTIVLNYVILTKSHLKKNTYATQDLLTDNLELKRWEGGRVDDYSPASIILVNIFCVPWQPSFPRMAFF